MTEIIKKPFNIREIQEEFPALHQEIYGKKLIYFHNGATSQKPQIVINAIDKFYSKENSNIHRGVHYLSQRATTEFEASRIRIQKHLNARKSEEIIFTKGTTDSINLVAFSYGELLNKGDEIIIMGFELSDKEIEPQAILVDEKNEFVKYFG